jgi:hypothetical protein
MLFPMAAICGLLIVRYGRVAAVLPALFVSFMVGFYIYGRRFVRRLKADPAYAERVRRSDEQNMANIGKALALIPPVFVLLGVIGWAISKLLA